MSRLLTCMGSILYVIDTQVQRKPARRRIAGDHGQDQQGGAAGLSLSLCSLKITARAMCFDVAGSGLSSGIHGIEQAATARPTLLALGQTSSPCIPQQISDRIQPVACTVSPQVEEDSLQGRP